MEDAFESSRVSQQLHVLGVPLGVPPGCCLLATWMPHNVSLVTGKPHTARDAETSRLPQRHAENVCEVGWQSSVWSGATRKMVDQSHGYFMSLQELGGGEGGVSDKKVLEFSQYYRAVLHESVMSLTQSAQDPSLPLPDRTFHRHAAQLAATEELIWHLCEVLFLDSLPPGYLIQRLLEWVRWDSAHDHALLRGVLSHPTPEHHGDYWRCVFGLVMRGRMTDAWDLLQHHSSASAVPEAFASVGELLRKAPMVRPVASLARADLHRQWQEWRGECVYRKDAGEFVTLPELQLLVRVMCGEEEAFRQPEVLECCDSWYKLMVGKLLFQSPLVIRTDYDLPLAAENCLKYYPRAPSQGSLDSILLAALKTDIMEVIKLSSTVFGNWWFVAHLTNLLHHKGLLVASNLEYGSKLSEFLLLEYASSLIIHQSLWQIGVDYFSHCSSLGREYMALHIERVPLSTEKKALKVLRLCQQHDLKEQAQSVCRVLAMRAYKSGRLGSALSWCIRVKDSAFAAYLAEKYFDSYQSLGEFMDLDLLDHLGASMLLSNKLTFLCKYREFHLLYERRDSVAAGALLVQLLCSNTVPKKFWMTMLTDALQLLEVQEQLVFTVEQTYALSHFLQELTISPPQSGDKLGLAHGPGKSKETGDMSVNLIRLALARNLSRAMLETSS